jgi:hypothetical protein
MRFLDSWEAFGMKIVILAAMLLAQAQPQPLPNYSDEPPIPYRGLLMCKATAETLQGFVGQFGGIVRHSGRFTFAQQGDVLGAAVNATNPYIEQMKIAAHEGRPEDCAQLLFEGRTALIETVIRPVYGEYYACLKAGHKPEEC